MGEADAASASAWEASAWTTSGWTTAADFERDPSLVHLATLIGQLGRRVNQIVQERRSVDPNPDDPYKGLYVSDSEVDQLLRKGIDRIFQSTVPSVASQEAGSEVGADVGNTALPDPSMLLREADQLGHELRLVTMRGSFELDDLDIDILLTAIAPDVDPRFEKLFGYLHDDVTRKRPSIGLALELVGRGFGDADARGRFAPDSALAQGGLIVVDDMDRPFLTRSIRVPDRVLGHLLGDERLDPLLTRLRLPAVHVALPEAVPLARAIAERVSPVYIHDNHSGMGLAIASTALLSQSKGAFVVDLARLHSDDDAVTVVRLALREAKLRNAGLVVSITDETVEQRPAAIHALTLTTWPVVIVGNHPWDPNWSQTAPHIVRANRAEQAVGFDLWRRFLDGADSSGRPVTVDEGRFDVSVTGQFRLRPDQIIQAAETARIRAIAEGRPVETEDLLVGARAQNSSRLERLARRIEPAVGWNDLVLAPEILEQLTDVAARYRLREQVYGDWLMGGKNNRRLGVTALFAGPSGVGKTMAAEALAAALGLDLYTINLATVVDKYIGETEKNLERIFVAAEGVNGVIFFDEADALFGKRSEVNDARDRYANVEVAYLLQRLEVFEGIGVLATNLRTNIDEAFTRRLDALIDFPEPEEEYRLILWDRCLGQLAPRADDVELEFLARRFKFSGGNIRNIAVTAAFLAAEADSPVTMRHLVVATAREYRKLGRLCTESEFGRFFSMAREVRA